MPRKSRSSLLKSAVRPVLEPLESRQLMSATLTFVNPDAIITGDSRVIFNTIQNLDPTVPNATHNQQAVQIEDTGTSPLVISSIALSGPWSFVNAPAGGYTNVTVSPGTPLTVTLLFTQSTLPAHSYNETNYTNNTNGGAAITGAMTINSNDPTTPSKVVTLAGYWQSQSNNNAEPSLQTIINLIDGFQVNINSTPIPDLTEGTTPTYYGSEVASNYWEAADPTQRVHLQAIADFHTEGNKAGTSWYSATGKDTPLFTTPANAGQTLLPMLNSSNYAISNFNPNGAFGIQVDNEYSTDSINVADGNTGGGGHHFRFFPLVDENGNTVPNAYIVAMDYGQLQDENFDFQDNVFILSNVRPVGTPATPTNLTATSGTAPVLSWTAVNYSPVSYDVYSSSTQNGTYKLLNSTPLTTTTYTDPNSPIGVVYYHVTAIDATQNPIAASAPATISTTGGASNSGGGGTSNGSGGGTTNVAPVTQPYSGADYAGQPFTFNPLAGAIDTTGTINPATVVVTTPNHGGTATVASSGLITYTPSASFSGTETFTYTVSDSNSLTSAPQTITFTDTQPVISAPIVNNYFTTTLAGVAVSIPVLSVDDAVTTFNTSSVKITQQTTHGTVSVNSDGSVTYTPNATFIGGDTFTYTVADNNGQTSSGAIVDINVGAEISTLTKGANHTLVYPGTLGKLVTVTLNRGVADVFFDGSGTIVSTTKGKTVINGNSLRIRDLALSQTTVASALTISSVSNAAVNLAAATDTSPLGSFNARTATLSQSATLGTNLAPVEGNPTGQEPTAGTINFAGVRSIILAGASGGAMTVGSTGVTGTAITVAGTVADTNLVSTVALTSLRVGSWTNTQNETTEIDAPSVGTLTAGVGGFAPNLVLSGTGTSRPTLTSASILGSLSTGYWGIGGNANSIVIGSTGTAWSGSFAAVSSMTIRKNGMPATITATTLGALNITGAMTGSISATTARSIRVTGAMTGGSVTLTGAVGKTAALGNLTVTGAVTDSNITSSGNVTTISVGSLNGSTILLDTTATSIADATASNIGDAILHSLVVTSHASSAFSNSSVVADEILSATTGQVNATASGTEGLAAVTFKTLAIGADGGVTHIPAADLTSQATLAAYLSKKGVSFGTFAIDILSPAAA